MIRVRSFIPTGAPLNCCSDRNFRDAVFRKFICNTGLAPPLARDCEKHICHFISYRASIILVLAEIGATTDATGDDE
jgi:hypothetical protein